MNLEQTIVLAAEKINRQPTLRSTVRRLAGLAGIALLAACGPTAPTQESTSRVSESGAVYNTDPSQCNDLFSSATLEQLGCDPVVIQTAVAYEAGQTQVVATVTASQP